MEDKEWMCAKFKIKVLTNSSLNYGIKNDIFCPNFYWSAMDGHSKREVLEILNMSYKNVIARFLLLSPPPICQFFKIFSKVVTWYITWLIILSFIL